MIGITSYGAYVPRTRLPFSVIGGRPPKEGGPERSVAWNDEDAITQEYISDEHEPVEFLKNKLGQELRMNIDYFEKKELQMITFGSEFLLQHVKSQKFLSLRQRHNQSQDSFT